MANFKLTLVGIEQCFLIVSFHGSGLPEAAFGCRAQALFTQLPWCCGTPSAQKQGFFSSPLAVIQSHEPACLYEPQQVQKSDPCSSTRLRTASHQDCNWEEKVDFMRVVMSYGLIKPIQSFLSPVGLIQIQQLSEFGRSSPFICKLVASDLNWFLTLRLTTNSSFEGRDIRSCVSVCHAKLSLQTYLE